MYLFENVEDMQGSHFIHCTENLVSVMTVTLIYIFCIMKSDILAMITIYGKVLEIWLVEPGCQKSLQCN